MLKLTIEEIINIVRENFVNDWNGYNGHYLDVDFKNGKYEIKLEDCYGGEGYGERYWYVFKLTDLHSQEEVYFRCNGVYDSWNGTDWWDSEVVEPKEQVITVWESV